MATNYKIGVEVELNVKNIQKQLNDIKAKGVKVDVDTGQLKSASKDIQSFNDSLKESQMTVTAANAVFREAIDLIGAFAEQTFELDAAMTEFKKVSSLSGDALDDYVQKLGEAGKETGKTMSEMVDAATQFKKSGFSDTDAASLARVATLYQNIADEQISAGESAEFIISQMKAFNIEADNAMHIIDSVNAVSNSYALSSGELALNLGKASAAMDMGNTTFEETIGLDKIKNGPSKIGQNDGDTYKLYIPNYHSNMLVA